AWRVSAVGCRRGGGFIGPFLYRVRASRLRPVHRSASEAGSLNPCRKGFKKHRRGWSASSRNLLRILALWRIAATRNSYIDPLDRGRRKVRGQRSFYVVGLGISIGKKKTHANPVVVKKAVSERETLAPPPGI